MLDMNGNPNFGPPKIVFLAGHINSGKDEVAKILVEKAGFRQLAFADLIRAKLEKQNPFVLLRHEQVVGGQPDTIKSDTFLKLAVVLHNCGGWQEAKRLHYSIRELQQREGQSTREVYGRHVFSAALANQVNREILANVQDRVRPADMIISDWRLTYEPFEFCTRLKFPHRPFLVWIDRLGTGPVNDADSEQHYKQLKIMSVLQISNNSTLINLTNTVQMTYKAMEAGYAGESSHRIKAAGVPSDLMPEFANPSNWKFTDGRLDEAATIEQWNKLEAKVCSICRNHAPVGGGDVCKLCLRGNVR